MENEMIASQARVFPSASHVPLRTCIACRAKAPAPDLIRVGRSGTSATIWNGSGRSAYICTNERCIADAMRKGRLERALRTPIDGASRISLELELKCRLR